MEDRIFVTNSGSSLSSIVHVIRSLDELGISSEDDDTHDAMIDNDPESDSISTVLEKQMGECELSYYSQDN